MACQADAIPGHQDRQEARLPSDQQDQAKERHTAVEERVAVAANTQQPDIQVREDRAQVARHKGREKNADRPTDIGPVARTRRHIAQEQQDADQTVLGAVGAVLAEEAEDAPVKHQGQAEGHGKRDNHGDDRLAVDHLGSVYGAAGQP